ncbi:MAG TPA: thiamine pyrophosphate-dependent enzyme [Kofleriaceae bacterium]|nr:thiamine pyrophosphate-dependent enzyme [Kofleriaceae bacterium]
MARGARAARTSREGTSGGAPPEAPSAAWEAFAYFHGSEEDKATGLFRLVEEDGSASGAALEWLAADDARRLYRGMLTVRVMDQRLMALQRQGRVGFYGEAAGQEAAVVGSAAALAPRDWLVPALREAGAGILRGMSLSSYVAQIFGNDQDPGRGRQLPCHPCDRDTHYVVMSSCVGSQIPHAVGIAMGMKSAAAAGEGEPAVCMGYMGDGATSEPDFHVAMNFAGVTRAPVVLVCQNNQWAISTPGSLQTAAPTIALKGIGYGIESLRVDGNDVCAVYLASRYAVDKARRGGGPTFLELLTYRVSAHSSSDDPSRYRDETVTDVWREKRDPLRRMEALAAVRGWYAPGDTAALAESIEAEVRKVIAEQEAVGMPPIESLIEDVYEEPTWLLREQLDELAPHAAPGTERGNT